jgi:ubiquinone/menaquinone biosynthesis C-methylase UbiE
VNSVENKRDNKSFWNRYASLYDFEIRAFSSKAYAEMYRLMSVALTKDMTVLEVAAGTGLVAANVARFVKRVEATDFSAKMIAAAKRKKAPENVSFSVEDATALSFEDASFDSVIISNALHIMPDPSKALANISRVLKPNGLLIAPTFSHGHLKESGGRLNTRFLKMLGFETYSKWTPEEYVAFIRQSGFRVALWQVLPAAFPLVYLEARKA